MLELSNMWDFKTIRETSISMLAHLPLDHVDKIMLLRKYDIPEWTTDAYTALAQREKPLSLEDAERLGLDFTMKIVQVREMTRECGRCHYKASHSARLIAEIFKIPQKHRGVA